MEKLRMELEKKLMEKRVYRELIVNVMENNEDYKDAIGTIRILMRELDNLEYWIRDIEIQLEEKKESEGDNE